MAKDSQDLAQTYDRLLLEHGAALRRVASTYEADPSRRDDLFQDICLALWRALPGFRHESSERTFLFRIAHNRGLSHGWYRKSRREVEGAALEAAPGSALVDQRSDPESEVVEGDRRRRLRGAVRALPLAPRQILSLSLEGLSHREIAEVLGTSENTVGVRLHRARQRLREQLQRQGVR